MSRSKASPQHCRAPAAAPAGKPHAEVGVGNLPVALALAAGLLASGRTIHLKRKEVSWDRVV